MRKQGFQLVCPDDLDGLQDGHNDPWAVAMLAGIHISSDKDFTAGYACPEGVLVAAGFSGHDRQKFSFDVAVLPEDQGKGLGAKLVDVLLDEAFEFLDAGIVERVTADVVNPAMRNILLKKGFQVVDADGEPLQYVSPVANRWRMCWFPS